MHEPNCDRRFKKKYCVKMSVRDPSDFKVSQLKEKLRDKGLSSMRNKAELSNRLCVADPSAEWMQDIRGEAKFDASNRESRCELDAEATASAACYERKMEIYRREKELTERELQLARREIELLKEM